jgi:hypothetical protein
LLKKYCLAISHDELVKLLDGVPESEWEKAVFEEFKRKRAIQCKGCRRKCYADIKIGD